MGPARTTSPERSSRRTDRGAASWVTVLLVLGLAAAAYAAVVFIPPAVLHYEVKQVVRDYGNQAIKNLDNEQLLRDMVQKIRSLDSVQGVDDAGRKVQIPVVDLQKEDVVWERTKEPPNLHVAFEYSRTLELPWLNRSIDRVYRVDLNIDQVRADWGPQR